MGLPEYYLSRAMAATTFTQLPGMFNHFEPGYELYLQLLAETGVCTAAICSVGMGIPTML